MTFWEKILHSKLFQDYDHRGTAFHNETDLIVTNIVGNGLIVVAYVGIFCLLMQMSKQSRYLIGTVLIRLFAVFILFSAISRAFRILSFWYAPYWLMSIFDILTGIDACAAMVVLFITVKRMKKLPSYKELNEKYEKMENEIIKTQHQLIETKTKLAEVIEINKRKNNENRNDF